MYKLFISLLTLVALYSCSTQNINTKVLMYIGTSNNDSLKGIEYCYFDTVTGQISDPILADKMLNPNFLEVDTQNGFLYAVGATVKPEGKVSIVRSYKVNESSGVINKIAEEEVHGKGACYVALDSSLKGLLVADYSSGEVEAYQVKNDKLNYLNSNQHYGDGPYEDRQKGPHAHSIDIDPSSNMIYSADLGADKLMVYKKTEAGLTIIDSVMCTPGVGPRHFDFSPDGKMMAVLNELNCTVTTFSKDEKGIFGKEMQTVTLLPDTFTAFSKAADIHFTADGKFLYASNRGFDSMATFKVVGNKLEFVEFITEGIKWPRNFAIDPSGNFILVANQNLDNISIYKRNKVTGKLTILNDVAKVEKPICIKFYNPSH